MLDQLPVDLFRLIAHDYLQYGVKQLSAVDVAFCSHGRRSDWLALIAQLKDVRTTAEIESGEDFLASGSSLVRLLHWVVSRGVHISKLHFDMAAFVPAPRGTKKQPRRQDEARFTQIIPSVESLHVSFGLSRKKYPPRTLDSLTHFLDCFPNVKTLQTWTEIEDEELCAVLNKLKGLEGLDMIDCFELQPDTVAAMVSSLGNQLRLLRCSVLDDDAAATIAGSCHNLTTLTLYCGEMQSFDGLEQLCAVNAGTLQHMMLFGGEISEDLFARIATMCTSLIVFNCDCTFTNCVPVVQSVFSCCPSIVMMEFNGMDINIKDVDGQKRVDIQYIDFIEDSQVAPLSAIPFPVQKCEMTFYKDYDVDATAQTLDCLVGRFGSSLEALKLRFYADFPEKKLVKILKGFSNLRELDLCHPKLISAVLVPVIPVLSLTLRKLRIGYGLSVDATDLSALLDCFRAASNNLIVSLDLYSSITVLPANIHAIAEVFPRLFHFTIMHKDLRAMGILDAIVSGKLKAKRIESNTDQIKWLSKELKRKRVHHKLSGDVRHSTVVWLSL